MDLGIKSKRVLVTGASQGIGRAIALAFAQEGCRVSLIARREKELKAVVEEMGGQGKGHDYHAVDLMAQGSAFKAVQALEKQGGAFDIVIHNVGGNLNIRDPLASVHQWQDVWQLNAGIAIEINNAVVPSMKTKGWGRLIHISSSAAQHLRGSPAYATAKAYLNAYTQSLGRILAKDGIVVSAIMPGAIDVPGGSWDENSPVNRQSPDIFLKRKEDMLKHYQHIGRLGKAEDITPFVLLMASEQARFAAGTIVPVTGGGA